MGALVLEAAPLPLCIPPQHQPLAQQLHGMRDLGVEVLHESKGVPLLGPIICILVLVCLALVMGKLVSLMPAGSSKCSGGKFDGTSSPTSDILLIMGGRRIKTAEIYLVDGCWLKMVSGQAVCNAQVSCCCV